ncbi:MAG: TspO/MBR family protein [Steroidobacteraceae bacterium]
MSAIAGPGRGRSRQLRGLAGFAGVCLAVSALGGWVTAGSVETWYVALHKPAFNPPDRVFGPVWTVLYLMIALAGWRVWRLCGFGGARVAMLFYALQLSLNLGWSFLFFGWRSPGLAFAWILLLLAAILANMALFRRIDAPAGWLLAPYACWVGFAAVLNFAIWRLN